MQVKETHKLISLQRYSYIIYYTSYIHAYRKNIYRTLRKFYFTCDENIFYDTRIGIRVVHMVRIKI